MSTWQIAHPDTLGYHAQVIQWIGKYRVIPGLVNIYPRYGLQGQWYVADALFSFGFAGIKSLNLLNCAVVTWYGLFIVQKIEYFLTNDKKRHLSLLWIGLLGFSSWIYTQIRLTITSASTDFIACIFVLASLYLVATSANSRRSPYSYLIVLFLSTFAVTIKLSVALILLLSPLTFFAFVKTQRKRYALYSVLVIIVVFLPFLARNIITSGYPFFPSVMADVFKADWKYPKNKLEKLNNYITGYAKGISSSYTDPQEDNKTETGLSWLPRWWQKTGLPDKIFIALFLAALVVFIVRARQIIREGPGTLLALSVSFCGVLFWFVEAPDPRFGIAFITGFTAIVINHIFNLFDSALFIRKILRILVLLSSVFFLGYSVYRVTHFFASTQLIFPLGIQDMATKEVNCDGIRFNIPAGNSPCGNTAVPCIYDNCESFRPRGIKVTAGFKPQ